MIKNSFSRGRVRAVFEALERRSLLSAAPTFMAADAQGDLFIVNARTGGTHELAVTHLPGPKVQGHYTPLVLSALALSQSNGLLALDGSGNLYSVNSRSGLATLLGATGVSVKGLAFGSDGTLYAAGSSLYTLSTTSGAATLVGALNPPDATVASLALDPFGDFYATTTTDHFYVTNLSGGQIELGALDVHDVEAMALGPDGKVFGLMNGTHQVVQIDVSSGAATVVATFGTRTIASAVAGCALVKYSRGAHSLIVTGNGRKISNGSLTTASKNGTHFSGAVTHVFRIFNPLPVVVGLGLDGPPGAPLDGIEIQQDTDSFGTYFSVSAQPPDLIPAHSSAMFTITSAPPQGGTTTLGATASIGTLPSPITFEIQTVFSPAKKH